MAAAGAALLAHAGGWDEAAILLGPVIVFLVIRYMGRSDPPPGDQDATSVAGDASAPGDAAGDPTDTTDPTDRGEAT